MGALHAGHLSLAKKSLEQTDCTIATIFVNPTQFAAGEDLNKYPRTLEQDIQQLNELGVDIVFVPTEKEVYPVGHSTTVQAPDVGKVLEGEFRPEHFSGVCTVVLKLFNMTQPDKAYFGQKDFQQVAVIRRMVVDLDVNVEIVVGEIVRDEDGLAMSSRNRYLSDAERADALSLQNTIQYARQEISNGETDGHVLMAEMRQMLIDGGVTQVDYAAVCRPDTLQVMDRIERPAVILLAAHVGDTRLIDNGLVE